MLEIAMCSKNKHNGPVSCSTSASSSGQKITPVLQKGGQSFPCRGGRERHHSQGLPSPRGAAASPALIKWGVFKTPALQVTCSLIESHPYKPVWKDPGALLEGRFWNRRAHGTQPLAEKGLNCTIPSFALQPSPPGQPGAPWHLAGIPK